MAWVCSNPKPLSRPSFSAFDLKGVCSNPKPTPTYTPHYLSLIFCPNGQLIELAHPHRKSILLWIHTPTQHHHIFKYLILELFLDGFVIIFNFAFWVLLNHRTASWVFDIKWNLWVWSCLRNTEEFHYIAKWIFNIKPYCLTFSWLKSN